MDNQEIGRNIVQLRKTWIVTTRISRASGHYSQCYFID